MRVLLDTNIIIEREDNKIIAEDLQSLMKILNQLDIKAILHLKSIEDIDHSEDMKELVSLGVVEKKYYDLTNKEDVINLVGKRTVYSLKEIEKMIRKPISVILFNHHFYLKNSMAYEELMKNNILQGPPQSIIEIDHQKYLFIKEKGGIDEHFTFS
ncbi:MAG: hypothetical protein ACFFAN_08885 [Promethearchaeota archaeon]